MKKLVGSVTLIAAFLLAGAPALGAWQGPSRTLPPSLNAPEVGEAMPDFTLPSAAGDTVTFSEFLSQQPEGEPGWILVVFFRGTW